MADYETIAAALSRGSMLLQHLPTGKRDAELLLMRAIGRDRAFLLTHPEAALTQEQKALYENGLIRRARHEPVQYILGEQEFFGLAFRVNPNVLIPRAETEHLVEAVLSRADRNTSLRIADVGTGSGAIAIALSHALPNARLVASDISPAALDVARLNAERHGVARRIEFIESDLLTGAAAQSFEMIASNPPYVSEDEVLEPQVRDFEPALALFAGPGGLDIYRRLIPQALAVLKLGGWLLTEIGHGQRETLTQMLTGWEDVSFIEDLQGIPRVLCARRG